MTDEYNALIANKTWELVPRPYGINVIGLCGFLLTKSRVIMDLADFYIDIGDMIRTHNPKYLKEGEQVLVGFTGPFVSRRVTPRELLSRFIGSMIHSMGVEVNESVGRLNTFPSHLVLQVLVKTMKMRNHLPGCSLVRPKVVKSVHFCPTTEKFKAREYRDITSNVGLPTGSVYPTRDDNGNLLVTEFGLCTYKDHQTLSMQEVPENLVPGQLPRTVDIVVEDDLVDSCKPGDRVAVVAVYKALPSKSQGSMNGVFSQQMRQITQKVLKDIKNISVRDDTFDLLANSLAPSIYGHLWIKKAVVLLMLGGIEKNLKNGTHLRGNINMMMVGDPSVAKSQLLRAIMNIAPLAISTTGCGSSGVGLTAAVTSDQETGERRIEAGAMVLADRGVVCIDEFDKMNDQDRVAIHEVMEQQTVTIAKAGIHVSLNARCSVVAAANPIYGSYDRLLTPTNNIGLPDSLLSRFDLLFIVLDQMDPGVDRQISEHVLRMHRYRSQIDGGGSTLDDNSRYEEQNDKEEMPVYVKYNWMLHGRNSSRCKKDALTIQFLKTYIHYAKNRIHPELTDEASDNIATAYAELRRVPVQMQRLTGGGTLPITARTLEIIIPLSTAHAKLKLRRQVKNLFDYKSYIERLKFSIYDYSGLEVLKSDVEAALQVLHFAIYHQELTEMEEREQEREKELEKKRSADHDAGNNASTRKRRAEHDAGDESAHHEAGGVGGSEAMETDDTPAAEVSISPERLQAFSAVLGRHRSSQHVEQISVAADVESVVNNGAPVPYSKVEIEKLLEMMQDKGQLWIHSDTNVVYFM
ncbi:hypothetical protein RND71_033688 [Anisodus tanguticus]|uniref:DNA replication licensing factor MCM3 n=1 Tax=Anisodus tanguticus TaxID=243964 RepID=A0AAE1V3G3_9SOLA|nr:hypothetical protein RND71_033688 [Anisodus tanguticus]